MKKMIVIREGGPPNSRELDDYLYNSEVTRSDFIDMTPVSEEAFYKDGMSIHVSDWDVVSKDGDKYDQWHLIADIETMYSFDDRRYKAMLVLEKYRSAHCSPVIVSHTPTYFFFVYRVKKKISNLISQNLKAILESFNGECYDYAIDEQSVGSVGLSIQEEEDAEDAREIRERKGTR